jgi:hypothetical protein
MHVIEARTVTHPNGMVHHSCRYRTDANETRLVALVERPYAGGKQATLIKASYDFLDKRWRPDEMRFFYDSILSRKHSVIRSDELCDNAIVTGRMEYASSLEGICDDNHPDHLDSVLATPIEVVDYSASVGFVDGGSLEGFDLSCYDVYSGLRRLPDARMGLSLKDVVLMRRDCGDARRMIPGMVRLVPKDPDLEYDGVVYAVDRENPQ